MSTTAPLSPTARTTVRRGANRARDDRRDLYDVLSAAAICQLGVVVGGHPLVIPTAFGYDLDGPDDGGSLYVHGSVASRSIAESPGNDICVSMTVLDGLVLARSAFHHSMNYRSAVVIGRGRLVDEACEKTRALDLIVDHAVPGRAATLRSHTRKELAATSVIALPLTEASVKVRSGDPVDEDVDVENGGWSGVLPLRLVAQAPVTAADAGGEEIPPEVQARMRSSYAFPSVVDGSRGL